jgi:hypothetical protein
MMFAIKAQIRDPSAKTFEFSAEDDVRRQAHRQGDTIFVFDSENEGGSGHRERHRHLGHSRREETGIARQTPRVSIAVKRTALAKRRLERSELKPYSEWKDGRPETELNFKFYRQATNKIIGISDEAASFLVPSFEGLGAGG